MGESVVWTSGRAQGASAPRGLVSGAMPVELSRHAGAPGLSRHGARTRDWQPECSSARSGFEP